jgi:NADPH-dependent curcumin reductase CurA
VKGREVQLVRYPDGEVVPSDFRIVEVDVAAPGEGEVLVRNTWTSVDAGLRLRLRAKGPEGYFTAFPREAPMEGIMTVGEVVESRADGFEIGDTVWHASGWRDYAIVEAGKEALAGIGTLTKLDTTVNPPQAYLGVLGGNGLTAYAGLFHAAGLREGDVVWVSAAAGAVGSLVAQLAKIRGHRVVASAGSEEKVAWLRDELGVDAAFNYRSGPLPELLREAAPDGIDVYFDNVGGDHLEAAIGALRRFGRVAICGAISEYDADTPPPGPSNMFLMVAKDLTIRGFRGSSYVHLFAEMSREMGAWLREGRIQYRETIVEGLERAPEALASLMRGDNTGKTLVRI